MTEREMLLRAVCENPADDTVRLAFADYLQESGEGERAEFIRAQVELARCGLPHKRVGYEFPGPTCLHSAGPDYWRYTEDQLGYKPGDRVDVRYDHGAGARVKRGLIITKVEGGIVTVKRDAESGPWKGAPLAKRSNYLLDWESLGLWFAWPGCPGVRAQFTDRGLFEKYRCGPKSFAALFQRGFASEVRCPLADFLSHAKELFARHPVTAVKLSDREPREMPAFPEGSIWTWDSSLRDRESPSTLPPELWRYAAWPAPDAVKDWLSRRCVQFGRTLAGLPPLKD